MKKPVIEFQNYTFQYRSQATPTLHDINLTIYEGGKRADPRAVRVGEEHTWPLH